MADIIAAISTALAPSGIGVIRLSGDNCARTAAEILTPVHGKPLPEAVPRKLCLYDLHDRQGRIIDRILAVYTPAPTAIPARTPWSFNVTAPLRCSPKRSPPCFSTAHVRQAPGNLPSAHF